MKQKVMIVGDDQEEIIWDMLTEKEISVNNEVYTNLRKYIDLDKWRKEYWVKYNEWLESDIQDIHDIHHPINKQIIDALIEYNKISNNKLYYWFDVDRSLNLNFKWKTCPISNEPLLHLSNSYHPNNRLVSGKFPLVFPESDSD
jgi:hypothetical protein